MPPTDAHRHFQGGRHLRGPQHRRQPMPRTAKTGQPQPAARNRPKTPAPLTARRSFRGGQSTADRGPGLVRQQQPAPRARGRPRRHPHARPHRQAPRSRTSESSRNGSTPAHLDTGGNVR
ncbi:MAG: hypothetical protein WKG07_19335 [Hymenobacter sp.]